MEYNRRHSGTDIQGNSTRTKKKETKTTKPTTINQLQQPPQEKHNHRFKKPKPPITNLSSHILTKHQVSLLAKWLNFIPTPKKDHPAKILQDILLFDRKLRLKYFYQPNSNSDPDITTDAKTNTILNPSLGWTPPSGQDPFLDTYRSSIINEFLKELDRPSINTKKSLKKQEYQAMRELYNNNDIVMKPVDKGGSIVIKNTTDYISEADRQLNNHDHYGRLLEDPTQKFNTHINNLINQAWRLNIIDESTYSNLQTKNPRIPTFYLLPKIHKKDNPGRPIVNDIGSVTAKISAYVDTFLRKYTPRIPSYIKDTTHFLNLLKHQKIQSRDLLVTIDIKSLYTNIPHTEGITAITRMIEDTGLDTLHKMFICNFTHQVLTKNYFQIQ